MVISQKASEKNVGYRGSKSDFKEVTSYTLLGFALSESTGLISFILINIFFHFTFFLGSADSADLLIAITPIGASHFCTVTGNDNSELVPVAVYENSDLQKVDIIKDNKGKSGISRWVNKDSLRGKSYVGSGTNLGLRFYNYYNIKYLM